VVYREPHGHRNIFVLEDLYLLEYPILINLKILLAQTRNRDALPVSYGGVQHDQGNIDRDSERTLDHRRNLVFGGARQDREENGSETDSLRNATLSRPRQLRPHSSSPSNLKFFSLRHRPPG
jgi:hypothetical protein